MEQDDTLRQAPVELKSEEYLRRNALVDKPANILESEFPLVLRMPH